MTLRLYDTTLRDGTQREGLSLSVEDKLKIARALDRLGVSYIEGGWPGSNPKDAEFFRRIREAPLERASIAAFGSTRRAGTRCEDDANLRALRGRGDARRDPGGQELHAARGPGSGDHARGKPAHDRRERGLLQAAGPGGRVRRRALLRRLSPGCRTTRSRPSPPLSAAGADCLVLCDTNGGELPEVVAERVREVLGRFPTPVGIHPHNDAGLAVANGLAAVRAGCVQVQGTINGYGERCGNLDLVPLVATLQLKLGCEVLPAESLRRLTEVSQYVAAVANQHPDPHAPYVGRSAFAHKGGIHVAAVAKAAESYQHVDPAAVGNEMRVVVSEVAGRRNVRLRAEALGLDPGERKARCSGASRSSSTRGFSSRGPTDRSRCCSGGPRPAIARHSSWRSSRSSSRSGAGAGAGRRRPFGSGSARR